MWSRLYNAALLSLAVILFTAIELLFLAFHFACGFATILCGFIGFCLETCLHKALPHLYD